MTQHKKFSIWILLLITYISLFSCATANQSLVRVYNMSSKTVYHSYVGSFDFGYIPSYTSTGYTYLYCTTYPVTFVFGPDSTSDTDRTSDYTGTVTIDYGHRYSVIINNAGVESVIDYQ